MAYVDSVQSLRLRQGAARQSDVLLGMMLESSLAHIRDTKGPAAAASALQETMGAQPLVGYLRYPVAGVLKLVERNVPQELGPEAWTERVVGFGRAATRHYFESPAGKMLLALTSKVPHELLPAALEGYKMVMSFGERTYERMGERSAVLKYKDDLLGPGWALGTVLETMELSGQVRPTLETDLLNIQATDFLLHIRW